MLRSMVGCIRAGPHDHRFCPSRSLAGCSPAEKTKKNTPDITHGAPAIFRSKIRLYLSHSSPKMESPMGTTRRRWRVYITFPVVLAALIVATAGRVGAALSRRPVDCDFVCKVRCVYRYISTATTAVYRRRIDYKERREGASRISTISIITYICVLTTSLLGKAL